MKLKRYLPFIMVLILIISLMMPAAYADTEHENFVATEYNDTNGLPTSEANAVIQSSDGYLWIGSYGGLIRYDGTNFINFSSELGTASVRCIFQASDGCMYIGTNDNGVFVFYEDSFSKITSPEGGTFSSIRGFTEDSSGNIYVSASSGVAIIEDDALQEISFTAEAGEQFFSIAADGADNIWVVSGLGNTYVLSSGGRLIHCIHPEELFSEGHAGAVAYYDGNICVGSNMNEIAFISDMVLDSDFSYTSKVLNTGDVSQINSLTATDDGKLLISALSGFGYIRHDESAGDRLPYCLIRVDDYSGSSVIDANSASSDHEGNYWVASGNYGLVRFTSSCFESCNKGNELGNVAVNAICMQGGIFYIATDSGLLTFDEAWAPVEMEISDFFDGIRIRNICADGAGRVWFATHSEYGAVSYDVETGKIETFGPSKGLLSDRVRVVYPLSDGKILAGHQMGFDIIDGDKICASYSVEDGMSEPSVLCAMEQDGRIYVGTDGSGIFSIPANECGAALQPVDTENQVVSGVILRMCPDEEENGCFFISAGDSLYYCDGKSFRPLNGIKKSTGSIYDIQSRGGYVYIMQDAGIYFCSREALLSGIETYTSFSGQSRGLTGSLSANTWNWTNEDGELYISTKNGVSIFRFEIPELSIPFGIVSNVNVDGTNYDHPQRISVGKDCQRITVSISALLFSDTVEFNVGYQLLGFDESETIISAKSTDVSYTNIPGGEYEFTMHVINPATGEISKPTSIIIEKEKSLKEYPLFYAGLALFVVLLAAGVSILIVRAKVKRMNRHQEELNRITLQSLNVVANTIDAKDTYTKGHSTRVAAYAKELARRMGHDENYCERIYYIALLHDIGKIGVPDAVLNKKGKLDDEEFALIKKHPATGGDILKDFANVPGLEDGARYHHERYDGRGYCEGLKGETIPEVARIICVADCYDAMQSARCYRPALTEEVIRSEFAKCSGTQFDPSIVVHMISMIDDGTAPCKDE